MSRDALIVGINTYTSDRLENLSLPSEDAEAIAQLLAEYGKFRIKRLPEWVQKDGTIRTGRKTKVELRQLKKAVEQLFLPEGENQPQTALFYFSGHGLRDDSRLKQGYLASSDTDPEGEKWGLSLEWLQEVLKKSPIQEQIVLLDCCYSGELLKEFEDKLDEADPGNRDDGDRCFITACRSFELSYEETSGHHGVLTGALLKGLDPRQQPNGWVTSHSLKRFIDRELKSETQHPLCHNWGKPIVLTGKKPQPDNASESGICPYKGLEYFREGDVHFFYGRKSLTDELIEKVQKLNFLAVLGGSGAGKSSVLRAGLLHQLKLGKELPGSDRWLICEPFTPGTNPLQSLEEAIRPHADNLSGLARVESKRVLLVIDQFEECFTQCLDNDKREQFFNLLLDAVEQSDKKLCIIIGMRADFLGKAAEYARLAEKIDRTHITLVKPMTAGEIEEAILNPAKEVGLQVEAELVKQLKEDALGEPGSLPLLQYALKELWQARQEPALNWLTLFAYNQLGGEQGGIKGILEKRANEVYESLAEEEKPVARRIFLELTQVEETADTRRRVRQQDLVNPEHSEAILEKAIATLAEARLITATSNTSLVADQSVTKLDRKADDAVIDIAHEALIRHWRKLRQWVEEYRVPLQLERKIEGAAREWEEKGRPEGLLLREDRLVEAEGYQKDYLELGFLDGIAREFIEESQKLRDRLQTRNQITQVGVTVVAVLLFCLAIIAEGFRRSTQLRENVAAAQNLLSTKPVEGLLLAIHATGQSIAFPQGVVFPHGISSAEAGLFRALEAARERNVLRGHKDAVTSVAFNPKNDGLASAGADGTVRLWKLNGEPDGQPLRGHQGAVNAIAFSRDGQRIASAGQDGKIQLWDLKTKTSQTLTGHEGSVNAVAFSPTETNILVSGGDDGVVRLWNLGLGLTPETIGTRKGRIRAVAFSPDGKTIGVSGAGDIIRLWNLDRLNSQPELIASILNSDEEYADRIASLAFSPNWDKQKIIISSHRSLWSSVRDAVKIWDIDSDKPIRPTIIKAHDLSASSVAFSPNGSVFVSGGDDGTLQLRHSRQLQQLQFDREGEQIGSPLVGHQRKYISVLNDYYPFAFVASVAFSPDGQTIASAGSDGTVRLWSAEPFSSLKRLPVPGGEASRPIRVVSIYDSFDESLRLFEPDGTKLIEIVARANSLEVREVEQAKTDFEKVGYSVYSPRGNRIATESDNNKIWVRDSRGKPIVPQPFPFPDDLKLMALSSSSNRIALVTTSNTIEVRDFEGNIVSTDFPHEGEVDAIALSPDGQYIVTADSIESMPEYGDSTLRLWNLEGTLIGKFDFAGATDPVLAFSPSGKSIIGYSPDSDPVVQIFPGNWQALLEVACYRLQDHPEILEQDNVAKGARDTCQKHVWDKKSLSQE